MAAMRAFQQGRFEALPEEPPTPHAYARAAAEEYVVDCPTMGSIRTHVRTMGEGPPLLLIHGLMTSSYSWRYVLEPLAERFRLWVPDLPGAGQSAPPEGPCSLEALADWLGSLQRTLGIEGCATIGNSMGGLICMRRALDAPSGFRRLVNLHSPFRAEARLWALHGALSLPLSRALLGWWVRRSPERWAHANVHYFDEGLKSLEEARVYADPLRTEAGTTAFASWLGDGLAPASLRRLAAELQERGRGEGFPVPLQLVYARQDPMVPPANGPALAALLPDASLHWLEDSSHFAHVDTPAAFLDVVMPFLLEEGGSHE